MTTRSVGLTDAKLDGHRPKKTGVQRGTEKRTCRRWLLAVLRRRTLPKTPEASGMSRHSPEQTNLQERGGPNRRYRVSDMHEPC